MTTPPVALPLSDLASSPSLFTHSAMTTDGLLYRYRGTDPQHPDNVGLRLAMQRQCPIVYVHGIVAGQYFPEWPVYVVGDAPERLTFTVNIDDRRLAAMQPRDDDEDAQGSAIHGSTSRIALNPGLQILPY